MVTLRQHRGKEPRGDNQIPGSLVSSLSPRNQIPAYSSRTFPVKVYIQYAYKLILMLPTQRGSSLGNLDRHDTHQPTGARPWWRLVT
jgi:hypothetical protein